MAATIYGQGNQEQIVPIRYAFRTTGGLFSLEKIVVNEIELLTDLEIESGDLNEDLATSIAIHQGISPWRVRIECNVVTEPVMMFV